MDERVTVLEQSGGAGEFVLSDSEFNFLYARVKYMKSSDYQYNYLYCKAYINPITNMGKIECSQIIEPFPPGTGYESSSCTCYTKQLSWAPKNTIELTQGSIFHMYITNTGSFYVTSSSDSSGSYKWNYTIGMLKDPIIINLN